MKITIPIRIKIILSQVLLLSLVSAFIYTYYPEKQKQLAFRGVDSKVKSISDMFSIGVGIGMGDTDIVAIAEALEWARNDSSVVFISVASNNGQNIASFNPGGLKVPQAVLHAGKETFLEHDRVIFYKSLITYQYQPLGTLIIGYSLKNLDQELSRLTETTLYFCLALFSSGVILSILIANMITRNITKLAVAVRAISGGAEEARVNVVSNDEIGKLSVAFNQMLDKLEHSKKDLIDYSAMLKRQNEELNQFSYVVSHDLKAPLRAIFKLSEWIEEDLGSAIPEDTAKNLKTLRNRVFRLESLINGLLEYSKIGRNNVVSENVDTNQLLKETIELLNPPSHVSISISNGMPVFKTKKLLLQQVFSNLISNAIKYNDKKDALIDIRVQYLPKGFEFSISDNGMGIDKVYHEKIFEIFQTLEARDKIEGTGIGLSIVKKSIEGVGGSIRVNSENGKGSEFIFTWPKEINGAKKLNYS